MVPGFLTNPIFGHAETRACFDDAAFCRAMIRVEVALAEAEAAVGIVPGEAARAIAALRDANPVAPEILAEGVRAAGVPVPALVAALRGALDPAHRDWLHWGATSQDIVDTAFCLCFRDALDRLERALDGVIHDLAGKSSAFAETPMLARTRGQLATPISFGLRVARWAQPLIGLREELPGLRAAALRVQFGGAAGSRQVVAPHGAAISAGMARTLGLADSVPWHGDRGEFRRLGNWLARLVAALAKIGRDLALSARGEVSEVSTGAGGSSSTMPHKSNPIRAEAVQSLAVLATGYEAGLSAAAVHAEERDGVMWPVEWVFLPVLFETAGAALEQAADLVKDMAPDRAAMQARIDAAPGVFAEAIVFAIAPRIGRAAAERLIAELLASPDTMIEQLPEIDGLDWSDVLSNAAFTGPADEVATSIFSGAGETTPKDDQ